MRSWEKSLARPCAGAVTPSWPKPTSTTPRTSAFSGTRCAAWSGRRGWRRRIPAFPAGGSGSIRAGRSGRCSGRSAEPGGPVRSGWRRTSRAAGRLSCAPSGACRSFRRRAFPLRKRGNQGVPVACRAPDGPDRPPPAQGRGDPASGKGVLGLRAAHAVESAINSLKHRDLDRVRAHGAEGFERTVALSVLALNVHRIGLLPRRREHRKRQRPRAA